MVIEWLVNKNSQVYLLSQRMCDRVCLDYEIMEDKKSFFRGSVRDIWICIFFHVKRFVSWGGELSDDWEINHLFEIGPLRRRLRFVFHFGPTKWYLRGHLRFETFSSCLFLPKEVEIIADMLILVTFIRLFKRNNNVKLLTPSDTGFKPTRRAISWFPCPNVLPSWHRLQIVPQICE